MRINWRESYLSVTSDTPDKCMAALKAPSYAFRSLILTMVLYDNFKKANLQRRKMKTKGVKSVLPNLFSYHDKR